jgi:hypothetical protein
MRAGGIFHICSKVEVRQNRQSGAFHGEVHALLGPPVPVEDERVEVVEEAMLDIRMNADAVEVDTGGPIEADRDRSREWVAAAPVELATKASAHDAEGRRGGRRGAQELPAAL